MNQLLIGRWQTWKAVDRNNKPIYNDSPVFTIEGEKRIRYEHREGSQFKRDQVLREIRDNHDGTYSIMELDKMVYLIMAVSAEEMEILIPRSQMRYYLKRTLSKD